MKSVVLYNEVTLQFSLFFFCAVFGSVYHRYRYEVTLTSTEEARAQYHLQKIYRSSIYKTMVLVKIKAAELFANYMVWVFHFCVFLGVSLEEKDIFSIILFIVESIVFTVHLFIEWNETQADRNKRMRKWTIASVSVIGLLIFCRYAAYFTRYYIGQTLIFNFFDSIGLISKGTKITDLFTQNTVFYRLFSKANSSNKIYVLYVEFSVQLLYLGLASLAMLSLKSPDQDDDDDSESSWGSSESIEERSSIMIAPKLTGLSGLDEYMKTIHSATKKNSKLPEQLLTNSNFVFFFFFLVVNRAITFTAIVYLCNSSSILDFSYILVELVFFILLFHNLAGEFKAFGLEDFNEKNIEMFGNVFCKQLINFDPINGKDLKEENEGEEEPQDKYSRITVKDIEHNCFYINSLLRRMQVEVTGLTTIVSFIKMGVVAIKTTASVYHILMYMIYNTPLAANTKVIMVINTILNTLILIELLTVKDYRIVSSDGQEKKLSSEGLAYFCTLIQTKLDYYKSFVSQSLWEFNRTKQISKISSDNPGDFLRVKTALEESFEEEEAEAEDPLNNGPRERNQTIKANLKNMGATTSISQHFAKFRLSTADPRPTAMLFSSSVTKATKIKIEPSEILVREKKEKFEEVINLYKGFKFSEERLKQHLEYDFLQTYPEFNFEHPETLFSKNVTLNDEYGQEMEDEFDLGLNTYENHILFAIGVGTPRFLKILLMHKNKSKFNYCTALKGCQYILRRLLLIPILYMVCIEPNVINVPMLLIGIYYVFHSQSTILVDIRFFMPIYSIAFFVFFIWNSLLTSPSTSSLFKNNPILRPVPSECNLK
jgi:hypothetical protein